MKTLLKLSFISAALLLFLSCNEQKQAEPSESEVAQMELESKILESNKAIFQAWNEKNMDLIEKNMAENFVRYQNGEKTGDSRQSYMDLMKQFLTAMPDMNFTYDKINVIGNKTYTQWTATGTQTGMFGELPPSNVKTTTYGFTVGTYDEDGKNIKEETYMDPMSFMGPWGYTLSPPQAE